MGRAAALNLKINNITHEFQAPLTIFQACLSREIYIPRFCYHVALKIAGNCRMCLVEEKSSLKPIAACAVSILSGQTIHTSTEVVKRAREGVLEYLLANHPLDCPICDQGGECDLQDQSVVFGADRGRFYEKKRTTPNKNFGFLIKTFLNRCIHCARCTRFLHDLAGAPDIQLLGRGLKTEISNYAAGFIRSEVSGNILDLCPVGALTSKPYAFKARPWELSSVYSFDIFDGFGSSVQLDFRGLELLRILPRPNKFLNEEWISDKTRFCYDAFVVQRLDRPTILNSSAYTPASWVAALTLFKNFIFHSARARISSGVGAAYGDFLDLEAGAQLKRLFSATGVVVAGADSLRDLGADFRRDFSLNNLPLLDSSNLRLENLVFFILNMNPRFEAPILNLKLRRAYSDFMSTFYVVGFLSNFNYDYTHLSHQPTRSVLNLRSALPETTSFTSILSAGIDAPGVSSHNISNLSRAELALIAPCARVAAASIGLFVGQQELYRGPAPTYPLGVHLYHHMEDAFLEAFKKSLNIFLPTRFYFEKAASYFNNIHNFFRTAYHYTYKLPNTREEAQIIRALVEFVSHAGAPSGNDDRLFNSINAPAAGDRPNQLFAPAPRVRPFLKLDRRASVINNFYGSSVVCRLSAVLSLCSSRMVRANDYVYSTII